MEAHAWTPEVVAESAVANIPVEEVLELGLRLEEAFERLPTKDTLEILLQRAATAGQAATDRRFQEVCQKLEDLGDLVRHQILAKNDELQRLLAPFNKVLDRYERQVQELNTQAAHAAEREIQLMELLARKEQEIAALRAELKKPKGLLRRLFGR